jgi:hypothetical protein
MKDIDMTENRSDFILYTDAEGNVRVEVFLKDETVWLTQKAMAELFGVNVPGICKHLANIYETGEMDRGGNYFHFGNGSERGCPRGCPKDGILQPGCHYSGRISREFLPGHAVPHLGDQDFERVHHQGFRA